MPARTGANRDFTAEEWSHFEEELDRIYADFTGRVATDRKISADKIEQVAGGRVWTGRQAAALGLVDVLGGFDIGAGRDAPPARPRHRRAGAAEDLPGGEARSTSARRS